MFFQYSSNPSLRHAQRPVSRQPITLKMISIVIEAFLYCFETGPILRHRPWEIVIVLRFQYRFVDPSHGKTFISSPTKQVFDRGPPPEFAELKALPASVNGTDRSIVFIDDNPGRMEKIDRGIFDYIAVQYLYGVV